MRQGDNGFWFVIAQLIGTDFEALLDTAARMSMLVKEEYDRMNPRLEMRPSSVVARFMDQRTVSAVGVITVNLKLESATFPVNFWSS